MDSPDQSFVHDFGPLHVPHKYDAGASLQDNVIFALAQLEYGTAEQVAAKLADLDANTPSATHQQNADDILNGLYEKGRIKGSEGDRINREYNLSKILVPNSGKADPLY